VTEDVRGELAFTIFKTAPKPIPLNPEESQYIADQILAKFNVTRKNNDQ